MSNPNPHNQWKPGQSGNPNGRPLQDHSFRGIMEDVLEEMATIKTKDGKEEKIIKKKLLVRRWVKLALKYPQFARIVLDYVEGRPTEHLKVQSIEKEPTTKELEQAIEEYLKKKNDNQ